MLIPNKANIYRAIGISCIFVVALSIRLIPTHQEIVRDGFGQFGDTYLYLAIAHNLYKGNGFSGTLEESKNAPAKEYKPTATRGPGYPFFIFCVYKLLGNEKDMISPLTWHLIWDKVRIVQFVMDSSLCFVVYAMGCAFFPKSFWPAIMSAVLYCFSVYNIYYAKALLSESLLTFLITISLGSVIMGITHSQKRWWIGAGTGFGLAILTRPEYILFVPVLAVYIFIVYRKTISKAIIASLCLVMSAFLVIVPWSIRNYICFKDFIIVSTGGVGINLFTGTFESNDNWKGWGNYPDSIYKNAEEKKLIQKLGSDYKHYYYNGNIKIKGVDLSFSKIALARIKQDPIKIIDLWIQKIPRLWYQNYIQMYVLKEPSGYFFDFYFIFALVGFFYDSGKREKTIMMPVVLLFLYLNCIFLPLHVEPRYGVSVMPGLICLTGVGIWKAFNLFFGKRYIVNTTSLSSESS